MRRWNAPRACALFSTFAGMMLYVGDAAAQPPCADWAQLVSLQGVIEARRADGGEWRATRLNDYFCPGDTVRVQRHSRGALLLRGETIVRIDQHTTLTLLASREPGRRLLDLLSGVAHFISRVPRSLDVKTPYVNAAIEGTEFLLQISGHQVLLAVYEGVVHATNDAGAARIDAGQAFIVMPGAAPTPYALIRPRDAVQWTLYYPPLIYYAPEQLADQPPLQRALAAQRAGDIDAAVQALSADDARTTMYRAALLLSVGRVDAARTDIERTLARAPGDSDALALRSLIATTNTQPAQAAQLARDAIAAAPQSPMAWLALSYAEQAALDLEAAHSAAARAVQYAPDNALARARLAELSLARGDLDAALADAEAAATRDPALAQAHIVLGFVQLARLDIDTAKATFEHAIGLDSAHPLARLGLGLARIREGALADGRLQLEIAASLDPGNALMRSYLGKAYYEEKRDPLAGDQLDMAKQLDPRDPTPWLYDAIRKQSTNRPVAALHDIQESIARNDNRAVYRSRVLLDQDAAARGASHARVYGELGFRQLAVHEATAALGTDPGSAAAHRFLAESYAGLRRHEIGRASEALQSQLFQPLTLSPVPPELADTNLIALNAAGPAAAGFNEYTPLFVRDDQVVSATAGGGSNSTAFDEFLAAGLHGPLAYSFGQYHYETDGFRPNNDLRQDIYNAFFQYAVSPATHLQLELRAREQKNGDLRLQFNPQTFSPTSRQERDEESVRLGYRHAVSPSSTLVASLIFRQADALTTDTLAFGRQLALNEDTDGYNAEMQYLFGERARHIVGGGYYRDDTLSETLITARPPTRATILAYHRNAYLYSLVPVSPTLRATVGASLEDFDRSTGVRDDRINPKLGLQWDVTERARLRLAGFRTLKRSLVSNQTLEPTQVAGFNQFFDDLTGSIATRYGMGLDIKISTSLFSGVELTTRDVEAPIISGSAIRIEDNDERLHRAYVAWTPHDRWAIGVDYLWEEFDRPPLFPSPTRPFGLKTQRLPVSVAYYDPRGPYAKLRATAYDQELTQAASLGGDRSDRYALVDIELGYRLPRRLGSVSLAIANVFDKGFNFHDIDFQTGIPRPPIVLPERSAILRLTLSWD